MHLDGPWQFRLMQMEHESLQFNLVLEVGRGSGARQFRLIPEELAEASNNRQFLAWMKKFLIGMVTICNTIDIGNLRRASLEITLSGSMFTTCRYESL